VGDYCRTLATALTEQGWRVSLIGLCDRHVSTDAYADPDMLRLPAAWPARMRYARAMAFLSAWSPEWISLQFVSWDFGWKGIVTAQAPMLRRLTHGRRLHFMFHETWVGGAPEILLSFGARLRRHLLGFVQRHSIKFLFRRLAPQLVHVSNLKYQQDLAAIGIRARQLPMFGSIAVVPRRSWPQVRDILSETTKLVFPADRSALLMVGLFGAVRASPIEPALAAVRAAARGRRVILISFGGIGAHGQNLLAAWGGQSPGIEIVSTGPLDTVRLSACFQELDAAISLHPACVIGRSSAAATLLEHGVPLLCPWGDLPSRADEFTARWHDLLISRDRLEAVPADRPPARPPHEGGRLAAERLLTDMAGAAPPSGPAQ
jgi:hypothetical protein